MTTAVATTELPDAQVPTLDASTEDEIGVSWTDVIDNGDYRVEYKETSEALFLTHGTFGESTTSTTITGLEDGEKYEVRMRTETEHVTGSYTSTENAQAVTVLPAPTDFAAPQPDWYETLVVNCSWTDNSDHADEEYYIQVSTDGGATWSDLTGDLGTDTTSTTLRSSDLNYDTDYELRVRVVTEHTASESGTVSVVTPLLDASQEEGPWLGLVASDNTAADRRQLKGNILGRSSHFVREHTAKSDWQLKLTYDESLEDWIFAEAHLYDGSEHLFAGEVHPVESDEGAAKTTVSGKGAPAMKLERGAPDTPFHVQAERADQALQNYLDQESPVGGTVTLTTGATVDDQQLQDASTDSEFNSILTLADTDPQSVTSDSVPSQQTLFFAEAEDGSISGGSVINRTTASGNGVADGEGQAVQLSGGNSVSISFTPDYTILEEDVGIRIRWRTTGADSHGREISLNGFTVEDVGADVTDFPNLTWKTVEDTEYAGGDLTPDGGPYTLTFTATPGSSDDLVVDCMAVYDEGGSRFTAGYNFDDTLSDGTDGGRYLDGPELYPRENRVVFDQAETAYRILATSLDATLDDTTGSQALGWSTDGGSTWNDTGNTTSIDDDTVSAETTTITGSVVLSRYGDRDNTTPLKGFNGQTLNSFTLAIDGETVGVIDDERFGENHLKNIMRLAKRAGVRFVFNHDPDDTQWDIEAFADGDVTGTADWNTVNRKRKVDPKGYANHIIAFGAIDESTGERLRAELDDQSEINSFGQRITKPLPPDPSLDSEAKVKSAARVALQNAKKQKKLTGRIDITAQNITPGKTYTIDAWSESQSLERVVFQLSSENIEGQLFFSLPEGLGEAMSEDEASIGEVRDAV
jgi:hypothetical protein